MADEVFRLQAAVELNLAEFEAQLSKAKRGFVSIFDNLRVRTPTPEVSVPDASPIKNFVDSTKSNVANLTQHVGESIKQLPSKIGESFKNIAGTVGNLLSEIPAKVTEIFNNTIQIAQNLTSTGIGFLKESVNAGTDFDKSMSQVAATMGKTVAEVSDLRDFAREMGNSTAFSATESADALNFMALAGYDAETSMAMLPNVLNLASAGGISLATASDMVTDSQSALGLTLDETTELVDKMAAASANSNTSVAQLGDAILTVGGTAKKLKGGTTELGVILGILADNGIKGAEGGTALRNILNSLISPTTEATKMLDSMGISLYDEVGNMRSLNDVFLELRDGMDGLATQAERDQVLTTIFNARDLKSAEALLSNVGSRFEDLTRKIDNSKGSAKAMADTQLDNLAGDVTLFQSALEGVKISISDRLTPALRDAVQIGTKGLERVTIALKSADFDTAMTRLSKLIQPTIDDIIKRIIEYVPQIVKIVTSLIQTFQQTLLKNMPIIAESALKLVTEFAGGISRNASKVIEEFGEILGKTVDFLKNSYHQLTYAGIDMALSIIAGFRSQGEEISRNIAEILTLSAEAVSTILPFFVEGLAEIAGILGGTLIQALPEIADSTAKIVEQIGETLIETLPELFDSANQIITFLRNSLIDNLPQITSVALEIIVQIVTGIVDSLPLLVKSAVDIIETLSLFIADNLPSLVPTVTKIIVKIIDTLTNPSTLGTLVTAGLDIIVTLAEFIIDSLPELLKEIPKIVESIVTVIVENLPKIVNAAIEIIATLVECLTNPENLRIIVSGGVEILASLIRGIRSIFSELGEIGSGILAEIKANIGDLYDSGVDMIKSFIYGIKDKAKDLIEEVKNIAFGIKDFLGFSEPDKGPLSNFHTFAPDMINLFTKGMRDNKKTIIDETKSIATSIKETLDEPVNFTLPIAEIPDITPKISAEPEIDDIQLSDVLPEYVAEMSVKFDVEKLDANQLNDGLPGYVAEIPVKFDVNILDVNQLNDGLPEYVAEMPVKFDVQKLDVNQLSDGLPEYIAEMPVKFDVKKLDANQLSDGLPEYVAEIPLKFDVNILDVNQLNDDLPEYVAEMPVKFDVQKLDINQLSDGLPEYVAEMPVRFDVNILDVNQLSDGLPEYVAKMPVKFDVEKLDVNRLNDIFSELVAEIQAEIDIGVKIDTSQLSDIKSITVPRIVTDYDTSEYVVRTDFPRYYAENSNSTTVENLNITLENGFRLSSDYDTERFINAVAERLQARQIRISRGTGGVQF